MSKLDPVQERQRLTALYAKMSDGELLKIHDDIDSLTDIAYEALQSEIAGRNLEVPAEEVSTEPPEFELGDFVMVRRCRDLPDAMMAKGGLESAGIRCHLIDENMVRMDWFISNLLGGAKLYVRAEDEEAARQILDAEAPESFEVTGIGEYERPKCPKCGSIEIGFEELNKPIAFGSLVLLSVPIPLHHKGWQCHDCGSRWMEEEAEES